MKRLFLLISVLALILVPVGCTGNIIQSTIENALEGLRATYTIEVTDTEGFNFTGRYVVVTAAYDPDTYVAFDSTSYDVSGNVSKQYTVPDAISVAGMFQKLSVNGTIEVQILKGGTVVDSATTSDQFGAVLVTATGQE
jgi:hypothetical protein